MRASHQCSIGIAAKVPISRTRVMISPKCPNDKHLGKSAFAAKFRYVV